MEDQEGDDSSSSRRWTCEACGCNTNEQSDNNCTICGTSNSGPSILRRAVGGPGYAAARAGWFARGFGSRRGIMNEDLGFSEDDLWESVVDGSEMAGEDPESAMESLAMEVSGLARRAEGGRQGFDGGRQRFLDAARASLQAAREAHRVDPAELLRFATENAASYHPHWANPSQMVPRIRASNGIEVGEGERQNLAHLPTGAGEGRAIRAEEPLPRSEPFGSFNMPSPSNASQGQRQRGTFGFRVAFDHPTCDPGANMGGCYLVGVTTSSFTAYGEQNGLQQSPFFWGIEDGGHKYEGSRYAQAGRGGRRGASANYAVELGSEEAPLNDAGVLFGSREVVTVVCDFESRTLTFWRDETLLGTLVVNLPRGGNLYPVAVPFNCGVTVAITGMDNDPLPLLRTFATDWRKIQQEKDDELRQKLAAQRSMLIQNGELTPGLLNVLKEIFCLYVKDNDGDQSNGEEGLDYNRAARLWYRCGMKLASLDSVLEGKSSGSRQLVFGDFLALIEKVVQEDEKAPESPPPSQRLGFACEVGDRVELVEGYEKYGDAAGGPLQPGDRGVVVELQRGPNGEKRSVRVLHNGRRWWYQPQAVLSEKSGLIESPSIWFLGKVLRSHGYDHTTLESLSGRPLTSSSWRVGDIVIPRRTRSSDEADAEPSELCFGRIVAESSSSSSLSSQSGDEETLTVEFVDSVFGRAVGVQPSPQPDSSSFLDTRRVRISKLAHFCFSAGIESKTECPIAAASVDDANCRDGDDDLDLPDVGSISDRTRSDVAGLARLDRSSIEAVSKQCKRSSESLASLFSSGLPEAILAALAVAERQMNSLEPREDLPDKISAVGSLAAYIANELFSEKPNRGRPKVEEPEDGGAEADSSRRTDTRTRTRGIARRLSSAERRQHAREVATRRDSRGEGERNLGAQGLAASLQQRRSMLLSLMSRARRSNASYFNEMMETGSGSMARDLALGQIPPPLGNLRGAQPFVFGPPSGLMPEGSWEEAAFNVAGLGIPGGTNDSADDDEGDAGGDDMPPLVRRDGMQSRSYLDSVLRCRGDPCRRPPAKGTATAHSAFLRHLIATGLILDSLPWVKASTETGAMLRNVSDDDGTPVLRLAVSFGCSPEVVKHLIACGAPVEESDMQKSATTNQPLVLASLLEHTSYPEGQIDLDSFSAEVVCVLSEARARQEKLEKRMRDSAGEFMVTLVKRLFYLARQRQSPASSKTVSEILIGNVLLQSLQRAQEADGGSAKVDGQHDSSDRSGRFTYSEQSQTPHGLFGSLPESLLSKALFADVDNMTTFLLLVEDCLCSKDMSDAAAGLTFLSTLLDKFPKMRSSPEIGRYGMKELVAFHDAVASRRLAEILSQQIPDGTEASVARPVRCPKKHIAVLHVTRHSSFRCDICGTGVDRGKAMHGCRECDWDACADCTEKGQGGIVKWSAIKDLTVTCKNLLSAESMAVDQELSLLSVRLGMRDSEAVRDLVGMLNKPGRITVHEFISWILPSLHASCSGGSSGSGGELLRFGSGHRSKKARVVDGAFHDGDGASFDSPEERLAFCKEVARLVFQETPIYSRESDQRRLNREETVEDADDPTKGSGDTKRLRTGAIDTTGPSELLRRLHQILSLHESVSVVPTFTKRKPGSLGDQVAGDLQALTKPLEIELLPSSFGDKTVCQSQLVLQAEPLLSMADLELHVLRTCKLSEPSYAAFCRSIALGNAIIIERPARCSTGIWQLAQVTDFDERTGAHTVRYGARWKRGKDQRLLEIRCGQSSDLAALRFDGEEVKLLLAVRECYILDRSRRAKYGASSVAEMDAELLENAQQQVQHLIGSRVQSNCGPEGTWQIYTLVGVDTDPAGNGEEESRYVVVSDDGIVFSGVRSSQIRPPEPTPPPGDSRYVLNRAFGLSRSGSDASSSGTKDAGALKRTWSALSLIESMRPVELSYPEDLETSLAETEIQACVSWKCMIGDDEVRIVAEPSAIQLPPRLSVKFSADEKLPGIDISDGETTLVKALKHLHERHQKWQDWPAKRKYRLFYSVCAGTADVPEVASPLAAAALGGPPVDASFGWTLQQDSRARKLSALSDTEESCAGLCDGLDEICIQCMEIIGLLGNATEDSSVPRDRDRERDREDSSNFANSTLSKKLIEQLDDPVSVAGAALPEWCTIAPSFAPHVFSYKSRRTLLERVAFGASRSTLKQQEAKVNIGRLRQRMAALRARAVELVGEAFSGGAEDPTALQLQADELYGMEEALAARVRAAFRAAKWQEHALQVAKAAVRRPRLLHDASFIMEKYANDPKVSNRRLEVRFDGESGFDQASGDEAGVTRGFYADVSEALLSSDTVAGVYCCCSPVASLNKMDIDPCAQSKSQLDLQYPDQGKEEHTKLPLWIPDFDTSGQVVIPTPRADECSGLGVYPRPLPSYHPQIDDVLQRFRFIGRLFAAAMRDGFMFPLPLSTAFLKLVQQGNDERSGKKGREAFVSSRGMLLTSGDLPRSGFLGGEVYAAETHICRVLDRVDMSDPPLSRHEMQKRYEEIASDKNFARVALGKSYDCSFEDYFQDRTFVDPLDPTQGEDAIPLCPKGHKKTVTIFNVREWVVLAKNFILHDGVIGQALAFRRGVEDFFSVEYLRLFTPEELQCDVCGVGDNVDNWDDAAVRKLFKLDGGKGAAEALVAVAAIGGEGGAALSRRFGPGSPTINYLVKSLLEASPKQRRQFLSFVTSVPIVTPGRIEVVPMVSPSGEFLPMQDPSCLPRANTCARRLYLPKFETYESFSQVLWAVVREESRFKGFFEWRG